MAIYELNKNTLNNEIAKNNTFIVEVYSDTCSLCKMLFPILEEMSQKFSGIQFYKMNSQQNMQVCMSYRILSMPTILIFTDGMLKDKVTGFKSKEEIQQILSKI